MSKLKVDKRIRSIVSFFDDSLCVADVGCDHGYSCVFCIKEKRARRAIATDISEPSLKKARRLVSDEGLSDVFDFRCGDGLLVLKKDEVDTIIISGVGGQLLRNILHDGLHVLSDKTSLVLSPNNNEDLVRRWLIDHNFGIINETVISSKGKYYQIMLAGIKTEKQYTETQLELGKINIELKHTVFLEYVKDKIKRMEKAQRSIMKNSEKSDRMAYFTKKINAYKEIIK